MPTASTSITNEPIRCDVEKDRAKAIILEIVRLSGERLEGRRRLSQIFYFAHLIYAQREPDYLSTWPIIRTPQGPGIDEAQLLIAELVDDEFLETSHTTIGPFHGSELRARQGQVPPQLSLEAIEAVRDAVKFCNGKSVTELSDLVRERSHSWKAAADGDELTIYVDLLSEEEYLRQSAEMEGLADALRSVW